MYISFTLQMDQVKWLYAIFKGLWRGCSVSQVDYYNATHAAPRFGFLKVHLGWYYNCKIPLHVAHICTVCNGQILKWGSGEQNQYFKWLKNKVSI